MGLLDRHGQNGHSTVRASVVKSISKTLLQAAVRSQVAGDSTIYTDALLSYEGPNEDYIHHVIDQCRAIRRSTGSHQRPRKHLVAGQACPERHLRIG
jgi:transposase-like protein